jgi:DNA-binding response OmpR family regulator
VSGGAQGAIRLGQCDARRTTCRCLNWLAVGATNGKTGWQVLSDLKQAPARAHIPVIIISVVDERKKALGMGASEYLVKPVSKELLLGAIRRCTQAAAHKKAKRKRALGMGASEYLVKPVSKELLLGAIRRCTQAAAHKKAKRKPTLRHEEDSGR